MSLGLATPPGGRDFFKNGDHQLAITNAHNSKLHLRSTCRSKETSLEMTSTPKRQRTSTGGSASVPSTPLGEMPGLESQSSPVVSTPGSFVAPEPAFVTPGPPGHLPATQTKNAVPTATRAEAALHVDAKCTIAFQRRELSEQQLSVAVLKAQAGLEASAARRQQATGCVKCKKELELVHKMPFCDCRMLCGTCGPQLLAKSCRMTRGAPANPRDQGGLGEAFSKALCRSWPSCSSAEA